MSRHFWSRTGPSSLPAARSASTVAISATSSVERGWHMDLGLRGKAALVTGGTSGIGLAIARRLGQEGCRVLISGRDEEKLANALVDLRGSPIEAEGAIADMRVPRDVGALVDDVVAKFGRLDIVVSNAGTHIAGRLHEVATDDFANHLQTKIIGPWELARRAAPHMLEQGGGRFIVIIGQSGKVPQASA